MDHFVEEVELDLAAAQAIVEKGDALTRLQRNKDFQTLVEEGYFVTHAANLAWQKATPNMQSVERQTAIIKAFDSIGEIQMYLNGIRLQANQAQIAMDEANQALDDFSGESH